MRHVCRGVVVFAAGLALLWAGTAGAGMTAEQKCHFKRAKEKGKYEKCVQNWQAKCYGKDDCDQEKLSKCRVKYGEVWDKLPKVGDCSGPRFANNGDSVTDKLTGLIWEKKTDDGGEQDKDNFYTWSRPDGDITDEDGTAFAFLGVLNVGLLLDGALGWRLPTFAELQTILLPDEQYPCSTNPCIDPVFGPTQSYYYWSSTTRASLPSSAWHVGFYDGGVYSSDKTVGLYVRAVRGGL